MESIAEILVLQNPPNNRGGEKEIEEVYSIIGEILDEDGRIFIRNMFLYLSYSYPVTIVIEHLYIDRVFRDSYYNYFSNKHFDIPRTCKRISIFIGKFEKSDFSSVEGQDKLQENVVGFVVIRPLSPGCIGRTLIDPWKLNNFSGYVRTTNFEFEVLGAEFTIKAFPFSSQDTETMTCAETTIWSILEYYGTRYPDYRRTLPSEILGILSECSYERVLPSKGVRYDRVTNIFKKLGFFPRLYFSGEKKQRQRLFHYYVESGIPIAVAIEALRPGKEKGEKPSIVRHSIVCIGHGAKTNYDIKRDNEGGISFINSADLYDEYILMDDNNFPYEIKKYDEFTNFLCPEVVGFVVPLYKRIFLEARDAYNIAVDVLFKSDYRISNYIDMKSFTFGDQMYSEIENPLVLRLYLTSSRHYKRFRNLNPPNEYMRDIYVNLPLPKFIWVAELSLKNLYEKSNIFGELIFDATASALAGKKSLVYMHYPRRFAWRGLDDSLKKFFDMLSYEDKDTDSVYPLYINNLIGRKE